MFFYFPDATLPAWRCTSSDAAWVDFYVFVHIVRSKEHFNISSSRRGCTVKVCRMSLIRNVLSLPISSLCNASQIVSFV